MMLSQRCQYFCFIPAGSTKILDFSPLENFSRTKAIQNSHQVSNVIFRTNSKSTNASCDFHPWSSSLHSGQPECFGCNSQAATRGQNPIQSSIPTLFVCVSKSAAVRNLKIANRRVSGTLAVLPSLIRASWREP